MRKVNPKLPPDYPLVVDWGHPLAHMLRVAIPMNEARPRNLANSLQGGGAAGTSLTNFARAETTFDGLRYTPYGTGMDVHTSAQGVWSQNTNASGDLSVPANRSVFVVAMLDTIAGAGNPAW